MRLLLTVHQFLPDFSAGTELLTYAAAKELKRRGHHVEIFSGFPDERRLQPEERFDEYRFSGIRVHRYHHSFRAPPGAANLVEAEYQNAFFGDHFAGFLRERRPDLVHFFHLGRLSASPIWAVRELGIPSVFTATDFWFICPFNQLRLPDNSPCPGPDERRLNCVRHVAQRTRPGWLGAVAAKTPGLILGPAVGWTGARWWPERKYGPLVQALVQRPDRLIASMNQVDRILAPTDFMIELMLRYGVEPRRLRQVRYGIDRSLFRAGRSRSASDPLRLGFIGSLVEHKGAHVLVEAVRSLPADLPMEVSLFGRLDEVPRYVDDLRRRAAGDSRIQFRGTFRHDRIGEVIASLDALVVPSVWYENTPLVVYQAQAGGVPVIASDVPGLREAVRDGVDGLFFSRGDVSALAGHLRRLVTDRSILVQLARTVAEPKSIEDFVDDLEAIYAEVIEDRRDASGRRTGERAARSRTPG